MQDALRTLTLVFLGARQASLEIAREKSENFDRYRQKDVQLKKNVEYFEAPQIWFCRNDGDSLCNLKVKGLRKQKKLLTSCDVDEAKNSLGPWCTIMRFLYISLLSRFCKSVLQHFMIPLAFHHVHPHAWIVWFLVLLSREYCTSSWCYLCVGVNTDRCPGAHMLSEIEEICDQTVQLHTSPIHLSHTSGGPKAIKSGKNTQKTSSTLSLKSSCVFSR